MPLPAALQARLLKRGIIKDQEKKDDQVEEVFAESYDEPNDNNDSGVDSEFETQIANCPNRANQYHECTNFCKKRYGVKKFQPHPVMEKRRIRMLKIYPLPENWKEVPDINTNRYYYWNTETDQVCWYSPTHSKAKLEYSSKGKPPSSGNKSINYAEESIDEIDELLESYQDECNQSSKKSSKQQHHHNLSGSDRKSNKRDKKSSDLIDPMDPSSYSDIPKGKWSAGLADGR